MKFANKKRNIRVAWAEDSRYFKSVVVDIFKRNFSNTIEILFTADNGREMIEHLEQLHSLPDIIILDIKMPVMDGITAAKIIKERYDQINLIAFSEYDLESNIIEMNKVGVKGFLTKNRAEDLITAIEIVHGGGVFFSEEIAIVFQGYLRKKDQPQSIAEFSINKKISLSPQQLRLIKLIAQGKTSKEIAPILGLTIKSVQTYRERLLKKAGVRNVAELLGIYFGVYD